LLHQAGVLILSLYDAR